MVAPTPPSKPVLAGATARTAPAPIKAAKAWLESHDPERGRPVLDVSQAAPSDPPPQNMRDAIADFVRHDPEAHLYGAILGDAGLRADFAAHWSNAYDAQVSASQVAITSGCNQAFCAVITALCSAGDNVLLPVPWYFNHKMWLDVMGVEATPLPTGANLLPDASLAHQLITKKTKAICLVSPNNPSGVEYPDAVLNAFYQLAKDHDLTLIIDETYKDFHSNPKRPHSLLDAPDWKQHLVQLYSFSKAYRMTGHRVGAIIAHKALLAEVEKYLDTTTICASRVGQFAARWGVNHLQSWLAGQRKEILQRQSFLKRNFEALERQGWELLGCGAYFAYVKHPFANSGVDLAQKLVAEAGILCLPGDMFAPPGTPNAAKHLRLAFANIDQTNLKEMIIRLSNLTFQLAPDSSEA